MISKFQQRNYNQVIIHKFEPTLELIQIVLIKKGFILEDLRLTTLMAALRDKKKDYYIAFTKNEGLIKELIDKGLYPLLNDKNIAEIWIFLENRF